MSASTPERASGGSVQKVRPQPPAGDRCAETRSLGLLGRHRFRVREAALGELLGGLVSALPGGSHRRRLLAFISGHELPAVSALAVSVPSGRGPCGDRKAGREG
jgi:hypothetical protein